MEILGRFYANSIFQNELEPYQIHFLLSILNELNFKQLCILSIVGKKEKYLVSLKPLSELKAKHTWYLLYLIQNEISNMMLKGLLIPSGGDALISITSERHIQNCKLSAIGEMLFNITNLNLIDEVELEDIIKYFI